MAVALTYEERPLHFLTVARPRELRSCAALVGSLARNFPEAEVTAVVLADHVGDAQIDGATLVGASEFGINDLQILTACFPGRYLNRLVAGRALAQLLEKHERVAFAEPQLTVVNRADDLLSGLENAEVLFLSRSGAGRESEPHPGVIALRRGPVASVVLESWPGVGSPPGRQRFQEWASAAADRGAAVDVLDEEVAHLIRENSDVKEDRSESSPGEQALFLDWGELDPEAPNRFLIGRWRASNGLDLVDLLVDYQRDMLRLTVNNRDDTNSPSFPDGTPVSQTLGRLAFAAIQEGLVADPFRSGEEWQRLVDWLNSPSTGLSEQGLTRLHVELWNDSDELQEAYPDVGGSDGAGYIGWLCVHAPERLGLPEALLPPTPSSLIGFRASGKTSGAGAPTGHKGSGPAPRGLPWGVNVAGFFTSELGLGEAARLLIAGLDEAGIPCMPVQGSLLPPSRQEAYFRFLSPDQAPFPVNIVCINGDGVPEFADEVGEQFFEGRYTIALWWWETDEIPEEWDKAFDYIDEVWVASDLVARAVRKRSPVPVTKITLPVVLPARDLPGRSELGLPDGFNFFFSFDYHSTVARKNPIGVIEAFKAAFPPDSGPNLIVKSINADKRPWDHALVLGAAGDRADIHFIDRYVTPEERDGLVAACDCYVTLHRSEGLGLTPAEALWFGKPVISTAYGGVMEFLTESNAYLVLSKDTYVGPNADPYPPNGQWQDPDIEHAASLMQEVVGDRRSAAARGERGARDIRTSHSLEAAGASMRSRLDEIRDEKLLPEDTQVSDLGALRDHAVIDRLDHEPEPRGNPLVRAARRLLGKLESPARERQRGTDREIVALIQEVDTRLRSAAEKLEQGQLAQQAELLTLTRSARTRDEEVAARLDELLQLLAEHRSLPLTSEALPIEEWESPPFGRVCGFRENSSGGRDGVGLSFVDAFRGTEEHVARLQATYIDLFRDHPPVLDLGCGRGELLGLLGEEEVAASGVDSNPETVERASEKGLKVACGNAIDYLAETPDESLGVVFSAQLVEHLPFVELVRMFELSLAKLKPGGMLVAETVNPHCVNALKTFWVDPTHEHPLFPETMLELARATGFASAYIFHPNASGDAERDRFTAPAYTLVARRADRAN